MAATTIYFADGFAHYDTDNILMMWDASYNASIESSTPRRVGENYLCLSTYAEYVYKNISSVDTLCVGFGVRVGSLVGHAGFLLGNVDGQQVGVYINSDGSISVKRGSTTLETSAAAIFRAQTWNWLEFKITVNDSTGSYDVYLNGQSILSDSNVDTQNQTSSGITQVTLYGITGSLYIADCRFLDDVFGDTRIDTLCPDGAGNYSQFTPSAGSNYECVDDDGVPDGDTTYNKSSTVNHKDSFTFDDLAATNGTILGVVAVMAARKDDADSRTCRSFVRIGGSDHDGDITHTLSDNHKYYLQDWVLNPDDSAAWEEADVNGAEFGYELLS